MKQSGETLRRRWQVREHRRSAGLCTNCGGPLDRDGEKCRSCIGNCAATKEQRAGEAARDGLTRAQRLELGLDILLAGAAPGERFTQAEIAAYAGCSKGNIMRLEHHALAKLRRQAQATGISLEALFTA